MRKEVLIICMIGVLFVAGGCTKEKKVVKATLEGEYNLVEPDTKEKESWIFGKDGYVVVTEHDTYELGKENGKNVLNMKTEDGKESLRQCILQAKDSAYELIPAYDGKPMDQFSSKTIAFKSGEDGLKGSQLFDGVYENPDNGCAFTFAKDGKLDMEAIKYKFKAEDTTLTLIGSDGSTDYTFELSEDGKTLKIIDPELTYTLERVS